MLKINPFLKVFDMKYDKYQMYHIKKRRIMAKIWLLDLYQVRIKAFLNEFIDASTWLHV